MKCGREPNGTNLAGLGICPAATAVTFNGINSGMNAGRFCWKIAGTMCFDTIKGVSALHIASCLQCPFFKLVEKEEQKSFS